MLNEEEFAKLALSYDYASTEPLIAHDREQRAEIERLKADLAIHTECDASKPHVCTECRLARAEAERDALRADVVYRDACIEALKTDCAGLDDRLSRLLRENNRLAQNHVSLQARELKQALAERTVTGMGEIMTEDWIERSEFDRVALKLERCENIAVRIKQERDEARRIAGKYLTKTEELSTALLNCQGRADSERARADFASLKQITKEFQVKQAWANLKALPEYQAAHGQPSRDPGQEG